MINRDLLKALGLRVIPFSYLLDGEEFHIEADFIGAVCMDDIIVCCRKLDGNDVVFACGVPMGSPETTGLYLRDGFDCPVFVPALEG